MALEEITAIATKSRFTKLKEFTSTEASSFLEIYLNDIDWAQWDKVHIDAKPTTSGSYYFYDTDAPVGAASLGSIGCTCHEGAWSPRITFHVGFRPDRVLDVTSAGGQGPSNVTYAQLVKMVFSGSIMQPGAYFVFWGEK